MSSLEVTHACGFGFSHLVLYFLNLRIPGAGVSGLLHEEKETQAES